MNPSFQCIILLACITITICNSKTILRCRCQGTLVQAVKRNLIVDVKEYKPLPYCKHHEVIVVLEDKSEQCIIPGTKFAKNILQAKKRMESHLKKHSMKSTAATTTSGATSSTISEATSSTTSGATSSTTSGATSSTTSGATPSTTSGATSSTISGATSSTISGATSSTTSGATSSSITKQRH